MLNVDVTQALGGASGLRACSCRAAALGQAGDVLGPASA